MCLLHRVCIFQFVWRNSIFLVKSLLIYDSRSILKCSHGTFVTFIQENEENYNFWDFSTTIFDIKCRLWMKLAPALVPLEAWCWYMLFLDLLSAKLYLGFLIELIEQILHTIKFGEILWSQAVYTKWGFKRDWNITGKIWDTGFGGHAVLIKKL
jgi:hypothetical protein